MALWDPEAAGNAAQYLRLDDIKLIDIRLVLISNVFFDISFLPLVLLTPTGPVVYSGAMT